MAYLYVRGLGPLDDFVTAFVALSPCGRSNGCLEFTRESDGSNFHMELRPGQFSLHSATVLHQATRNSDKDHRRHGVIFRYISGRVRDLQADVEDAPRDWAVLMSGKDEEGSFRLLSPPSGESTKDGIAQWEAMRVVREKRYGKLV